MVLAFGARIRQALTPTERTASCHPRSFSSTAHSPNRQVGTLSSIVSWTRATRSSPRPTHCADSPPTPSRSATSSGPSDAGDIIGLVYANGFAPAPGDSCFALAGKFPGSMLGESTLRPVPRTDGTTDLFITMDAFHDVFCPDVPAARAARLAVTQRPATQEALVEPSGDRPLWEELPSWFLIGTEDRIIPPALQHYMAQRAGARATIEIPGASHAAPVSQPEATANLILEAAASRVTA